MLLHGAYAVYGIEHDDLGVVNILEALESSLAGIAGGSNENNGVLAVVSLFQGFCKQVRQNLQSHILERAGGTVPKLKNIERSAVELGVCDRRRIGTAEFLCGISLLHAVVDFLSGEVGQKIGEYLFSSASVIFLEQRLEGRFVVFRELLRYKKTAVL